MSQDPGQRTEGELYSPLVWATGAMLATGGVCLAILMIAAVLGPFQFLTAAPAPPPARVGVWLPPFSDAETRQRVEAWRRALPSDRASVVSPSLGELREEGAAVLVLPDARRLTVHDVGALRAWLEEGGGAVLAGAVAVRDAGGGWRGFDAMREILAVERVDTLPARATRRVTPARRGPLSSVLDPDARLPLLPEPGAPALPEENSELRWSGDGPSRAGRAGGASLRRTVGRGRLAWLGFGPESAPRPDGDDWDALAAIVRAAVDWTTGQPSVEVLAWPGGRPLASSVVLTPDAAVASDAWEHGLADDVARAAETARWLELVIATGGLDDEAVAERRRRADEILAAADAWVVGSAARHEWVRGRGGVQASVSRVTPRRLRVEVTNRGAERVRGAALRLYVNRPFASVDVRPTALLQRSAEVRRARRGVDWAAGDDWVDLLLPELPARTHSAWVVDYRPLDQAPERGG